MHIHLDPLGGVAGDMFVAALIDAFPEHEAGVLGAVAASLAPVCCTVPAHRDDVLCGRRFVVTQSAHDHGRHDDDPEAPRDHGRGAPHRHWSEIREGLRRADLAADVRDHAVAIFEGLAEAEARVHGIDVARVVFHEVGAWDSIADIVAAAYLVATLGAERWTIGPLPLGSGRVMTAHGLLPVPAPATTLLLEGFAAIDDGIPGERVTPTGAAIVRHVCDRHACGDRVATREPRIVGRTGIGFGARTLAGVSNCLRVLVFDETGSPGQAGHREIGVVEFEVDDQSAEDLAMGMERLREHHAVFDVVQMPVFGKKGRIMTHVRALTRADLMAEAIEACFRETTTIGLRHHVVSGATLERRLTTVAVDGRPVRVKTVTRPGGRTAKAEADDALAHESHAARADLRRRAERIALGEDGETEDGETGE